MISTELDTINVLLKLGIKFQSKRLEDFELDGVVYTNPVYIKHIIEPTLRPFDLPGLACIKQNVVFTNNIDKGIVLGKIFNRFEFVPSVFVLIDDKEKNHLSMIEAIDKINAEFGYEIKYEGYWYVGADLLDNVLDPYVVELQRNSILKEDYMWVSDLEACELL